MKTTVRRYIWYKDIWFQLQILTDKTIQHYMFDNMLGVLRFFLPWTYDIKLICFIHKKAKHYSRNNYRHYHDYSTHCWSSLLFKMASWTI